MGVTFTPHQYHILLEQLSTANEKITFQSLIRALQVWKAENIEEMPSEIYNLNPTLPENIDNSAAQPSHQSEGITITNKLYKLSYIATTTIDCIEPTVLTYSDVVKMFRNSLLAGAADTMDAKKKLQTIFSRLDTDQNNILTTGELRLLLEELSFAQNTENPKLTMDLLVDQIDLNRFIYF